MTCESLRELIGVLRRNRVETNQGDVVRIVCRNCDRAEVCPALTDQEYSASSEGGFPMLVNLVAPVRSTYSTA